MPVKTWVGRFAIVDGQPQEESPLLRSFLRQRPDEEEDELYVLVEPASAASKEYCGQLVDAVGRMYRDDPLAITGAVLRALRTAHRQLRDWNQRTLREQQVAAGIGCLAARGRVAYLAQVGPSVAYHVGDGRFRRIVPEPDAAEPIGQPDQISPTFARYELAPGDLLLIASPRIEQIVDPDTLRAILLRGADEALVELFRLAKGQQEFSLVLLACVVEAESEAPPAAPATPFAAAPAAAGAAHPVPTTTEAPAAFAPPAPIAEAGSPTTASMAAPPPLEAPFPPGPDQPSLEEQERAAMAPPSGYSQPRVRLKGQEAEVRYLRTTGVARAMPAVPPVAIVAALILIVVGLIAWFVIPNALEESQADRFLALIDDSRHAITDASTAPDPAQKRELLRLADTKLQEAAGIRPDAPEVAELRSQVEAALAALNAVVELPELELIADLAEQVPGAVSPKDLALGGGGAYLLDREQSRVIAVALIGTSAEPFVLFQAGDLAGSEITGLPQQIAWAEELGALLIMDDARRLIAVAPPGDSGSLLTVRDAQAWGSANGMAYRDGNLYVLDRAADQVWRYLPSDSGFDSEREPLVSSVELEPAVEFAVGDALYLVMGDNSIVRVQNRQPQPFPQSGIDIPLASPGSMLTLPESGRVLVADRGNNRIVVFSADGTFLQQWHSATFTDLRAIAVDEAGGLLYILVGGGLYRTALPPPP